MDSGLSFVYFSFAMIFFGIFVINFFVAMMAVKYRDGTAAFDMSAKKEAKLEDTLRKMYRSISSGRNNIQVKRFAERSTVEFAGLDREIELRNPRASSKKDSSSNH